MAFLGQCYPERPSIKYFDFRRQDRIQRLVDSLRATTVSSGAVEKSTQTPLTAHETAETGTQA